MPLAVEIHSHRTRTQERSLRAVLHGLAAELPDERLWTIVVSEDGNVEPMVTAYPDHPAALLDVYGWRVRAEPGPAGGIPVYSTAAPRLPEESGESWDARVVNELRVLFAVLRESNRQGGAAAARRFGPLDHGQASTRVDRD